MSFWQITLTLDLDLTLDLTLEPIHMWIHEIRSKITFSSSLLLQMQKPQPRRPTKNVRMCALDVRQMPPILFKTHHQLKWLATQKLGRAEEQTVLGSGERVSKRKRSAVTDLICHCNFGMLDLIVVLKFFPTNDFSSPGSPKFLLGPSNHGVIGGT